ncbi:uncharacterized protein L3040_006765 [Drepanopeziza brunnea f. sp. 'multigermtubi']|uniref:Peroxin 26 n=1 Tax=Marssonina brunnea f. sp. multigermtubi (strain MB_m1) TaxID=1072389 RepID=K1WKY5_MARBU|nr:peroxin 26 [Drepanopeziza brunnea f. sp. 'multigermtubi' MB_m1]EKD18360.1 peroxin 26 [Drepanopeziza brunnea f. sp. 'multigermtubi' MB_m1]KAJ5039095.1 hypothetical protein L3040_006765 [Drepanopeziza brunnea f. sp. 'multigermtubi']
MTSTGSAPTLAPTRETSTPSQILTSSISSLSSPTRQTTSHISKIYRQASTLFLTRRLPESLSTILPVITSPPDENNPGAVLDAAPVSKAGKTTRVKVWSLYLTILNAVLELDPEEGKLAFGGAEWRALVQKVRDGEVWEDVVRDGYGGVEGDVDSDVVINLATLLLAHARSQKINQARLETYLATSSHPTIPSQIPSSSDPHVSTRRPSVAKNASGTDTPRDLTARVKILELYTLHVLLRNNEWDYAREFITISSVLDEERREAFLQALQSLKEEQFEAERRENEERRYQEEQLKRDIEDARRRRIESEERERRREDEERLRRARKKGGVAGSEVDYGVDETPRPGSSKSRASAKGSSKGTYPSSGKKTNPASPPTSRPAKNTAAKIPPTLLKRAGNIISNIQRLVSGMAGNFQTRPLFLMQFLAFLIGFLVLISRQGVKERLKKLIGGAWGKVRSTAGMGVKVSYI